MHIPSWLPISVIAKIFGTLSVEGESRLVGGCVRNILIGSGATDIDIATTLKPDRVMHLLTSNGIRCIPTGIKHGTVTAIIESHHIEITTLRKDVETDGRHALVEFTDKWEEDAARRDFTINALYMDLETTVFDFFGGLQDLKSKLVKFVGSPEERIKEDHLRILRYFRFVGYLGNQQLDVPSFEAVCKHAGLILKLSGERVQSELFKVLATEHIYAALDLMYDSQIFKVLGLQFPKSKLLELRFGSNPLVNLAAILRIAKLDENNFKRLTELLKLSNENSRHIFNLVFCTPKVISFDNIEKNLYIHGRKRLLDMSDLLVVEGNKIDEKVIENISTANIPKFPVKSAELHALGFTGPRLGKKLKELEQIWLDSNCELGSRDLLE